MTKRGAALLVVAAIGVAVAWYVIRKPAPEPGSRAWQIQEFRKDWTACSKFAVKREQARELLAWKPKPPRVNRPGTDAFRKELEARLDEELVQSEAKLKNALADMPAQLDRYQADELACLRDLDWPDVQIESLKRDVREADEKNRPRWWYTLPHRAR